MSLDERGCPKQGQLLVWCLSDARQDDDPTRGNGRVTCEQLTIQQLRPLASGHHYCTCQMTVKA